MKALQPKICNIGDAPLAGRLAIAEIPAETPPVEAFQALVNKQYPFFLDTAMPNHHGLGNHSYMGAEPFLTVECRGNNATVNYLWNGTTIRRNPFDALDEILRRFRVEGDRRGLPFAGGGVGFLSYDLKGHLEKLPDTVAYDQDFPDLFVAFYGEILAYEHGVGKWFLCRTSFGNDEQQPISERANQWAGLFERIRMSGRATPFGPMSGPESNFSREQYLRAVEKALEYIHAGDIYQVNLSQRFKATGPVDPWPMYKRLRKLNPAPMAAYTGLNGKAVLSSSPERFLMARGRRVETRPIKGTRPRGSDPDDDHRHKRLLLASVKDRAELNMIVDLERNDLGRVCEYGSVKVTRHADVESYATVHHLVSTVEGYLREGLSSVDILKATFPGGSITGAPKIRSMEIIDELETTARSVYTGAIGYFDFNGDLDLNIAIRTILAGRGEVAFQVGGGIVADSMPEEEYIETMHKGKAIFETLKGEQ